MYCIYLPPKLGILDPRKDDTQPSALFHLVVDDIIALQDKARRRAIVERGLSSPNMAPTPFLAIHEVALGGIRRASWKRPLILFPYITLLYTYLVYSLHT